MRTVILDAVALGAVASSMGIHNRAALVAYLGMELNPVTPLLIATALARLPITLAVAFTLVNGDEEPEVRTAS